MLVVSKLLCVLCMFLCLIYMVCGIFFCYFVLSVVCSCLGIGFVFVYCVICGGRFICVSVCVIVVLLLLYVFIVIIVSCMFG